MTKKEKVIALKQKRYSYRTISEMLDMPIGTVKSIWSRKLADENLTSACKNCYAPVTSTKGRKRKQFCDDKCRMEWWNSHRYLVKAKQSIVLLVNTAALSLHQEHTRNGSTVPIGATQKGGMVVQNKTYREQAAEYEFTMITAFRLYEMKIISPEDLALIESKTAEKYSIKDHSVYRQHNLL